MIVKAFHLLLAISILSLCGCVDNPREKNDTAPNQIPNTPGPIPNTPGSFPHSPNEKMLPKSPELSSEVVQDAWTQIENNPALPETNFKNRTLESTGKVTDIVKMKEGVNKGKWVLSMVSESNPKKGMTRCLFDRAEDLESTAIGKVARVQGRFDSWNKEQHCLYIRYCVLK
jgi:hypothetical protein